MKVQTTRFGPVEIDESRIITFPAGLLGFSSYRQYVLLQPNDEGIFYWLQSIEAPDLAFVVSDPALWVPDYRTTIRSEQMAELDLASAADAQTYVIINKYGESLTANLQGPLVVNVNNRVAMQMVLAEKRWTTRHEIVHMEATAASA